MDNGIDIVLEDEELEVEVQEDFLKGEKGDKGETGYTPVKGVDYYTEKEKEELVNELTEDINQAKDDFNTNVIEKTSEFNNNTISKVEEYNANASDKIEEYNANTEELINKVAELQEQNSELQAENERLREDLNGLPSGQAEGETIDITDSAEMRFSKFNISGNSKQETREGYNRLDLSNLVSKTQNGVTATKNKDGSITFNGTATTRFVFYNTTINLTLPAGTYKNSIKTPIVTGVFVSLDNTQETMIHPGLAPGSTYKEFTLTEETTFTYYKIRINSGTTLNNFTIYPMVYSGTEIKEYEQYGASPSPEYSSEVESCGDNVNLFDKDSAIKGAYYNSSNILTTSTTWKYFEFTPKSKRDYTIKSTKYASEVYFVGFDSSGNSAIITNFSSNKVTFNSNDYVKIGYSVHKDDLDNVKLVEGTHVGEYSPYGQGCITEVICNKNLAKILNGIWYNSTTQTFTTDIQGYGYMAKIKENSKITISKKNTGYRFVVLTSKEEIAANGTYSRAVLLESEGKTTKYTFTTQENEKYVFFGYYRGTDEDAKNLARQEIQIEISEVKTGYEVHKEQVYTIPTQQPMRAIGDIRDTFIKKNNKWYERHSIARLILNGTETISAYTYGTNSYSYSIADIEYNTKEIITKCTHFYSVSYTDRTVEKDNFLYTDYASGNKLIFRNTTFSSADDFKAWLTSQYNAGTPVYVDYVLAEPIDIECTEEQSTILWDIEQNAKTHKNITHMYSTDEISPVIEVTYKKDIETLLNNLQAIAISNATEEV